MPSFNGLIRPNSVVSQPIAQEARVDSTIYGIALKRAEMTFSINNRI